MADDDKSETKSARPASRSTRSRRRKTPVTIDLTAEEKSGEEKSAETQKPAEKASAAAAKKTPAKAATTAKPKDAAPKDTMKPADEPPAAQQSTTGGDGKGAPDKPEAPPPGRPPKPAVPPSQGIGLLIAGAVGGLAVAALLLVLQMIGLAPAPNETEVAVLEERLAAAETSLGEQAAAGTGLQTTLDTMSGRIEELATALDGAASTEALGGVRAEIDALVAASETAREAFAAQTAVNQLRAALSELDQRVVAAETAVRTIATTDASGATAAIADLSSDLADLQTRLAAVEATVAATPPVDERAAAAVALLTLTREAATDRPFSLALDAVAALDAAPADAVAGLRPLADAGVPTREQVRASFDGIADAMVRADREAASGEELGDSGGGVLGWIGDRLSSVVTVRPVEQTVVDADAPSVARMRALVAADDLEAALEMRWDLSEAARFASADWSLRADDRIKTDTLVAEIAAALGRMAQE